MTNTGTDGTEAIRPPAGGDAKGTGVVTRDQGAKACGGIEPARDLGDQGRRWVKAGPDRTHLLKALEAVNDGVWISDESHRIIYANQRVAHIAEGSLDAIIGLNVLTDFPEETLKYIRPRYLEACESGLPVPYEVRLVTLAGRGSWQRGMLTPLLEDGRFAGIICTVKDITDQRRTEQELAEESLRRQILLEQSRDGILVGDETGKVIEANQRQADMLGYTVEEMRQLHVWDFDASYEREAILEMGRVVDETGDHFETRHRRKNGTEISVEVSTNAAMFGEDKLILCITRDITERKRAEARLRASEAALSRAQAIAKVGSWTFDTATGDVEWSDQNYRIFDITIGSQVTDQQVLDLVHPEDLEFVAKAWHCAQQGEGLDVLHRIVVNGEERWIHSKGEFLPHPHRKTAYLTGVTLDITEQKRLEEALRRSEARYRALVETTFDWLWEVDADVRYTYVSPKIETILGYRPEEVLGRTPFDFMDETEAQRVCTEFGKYAAERKPFSMLVNRNRHKRGHVVVLETSGVPIIGPDGTLLGYRGSDRDVTARTRAEDALKESSFFLQETQRVGRIGGWKLNPETGSVIWTDEVYTMIGADPSHQPDLVTGIQNFAPEWREPIMEDIWHTYRTGEPFVLECQLAPHLGGERWVELRGQPGMVGGRVAHVMGTVQEITAHREAMAELQKAKEHAEAANTAKSNFLASMSHELRTPLNAIIGFSDLLQATETDPNRERQLSLIGQAGKGLLRLIRDLLDLSRIEAGRTKVEIARFDLHAELDEMEALFAGQASRRGLSFEVTLDTLLPKAVEGDRHLIRQILMNLIGNALKFTSEGGVRVSVETGEAAGPDDRVMILFHVSDTGIGIRPENQDRIFEMFEQEDSTATRRYGGSGLGLAISKRLVLLMGGDIWIRSEPGAGSCFSFSIPLRSIEAQPIVQDTGSLGIAPATPGTSVLVVEDDPFGQQLMMHVLGDAGYKVEIAGDGFDALRSLATRRFDLILLDIQLPGLSGLEVCRRIRAGEVPGCAADTPIIVVTAYTMPGDRERFLQAGATECLAKPIDIRTTLATLAQILRSSRGYCSPDPRLPRVIDNDHHP